MVELTIKMDFDSKEQAESFVEEFDEHFGKTIKKEQYAITIDREPE